MWNKLLHLRSLVNLERLFICAWVNFGHLPDQGYSNLTDEEFEELIPHLGRLRDLEIGAITPLPAASLESLSKHCPFLEHCSIPAVFDVKILCLEDRPAPMFPRLRKLALCRFTPLSRDNDGRDAYHDRYIRSA